MKTVGNLLWLVVCGVWLALGWLFWALLLTVTFIGLPLARQCVKLARFSLWPFGRTIVTDPTRTKLGTVGAILWIIPGVLMAIGHVVMGALSAPSTKIGARSRSRPRSANRFPSATRRDRQHHRCSGPEGSRYERGSWTPIHWTCAIEHPDGTEEAVGPWKLAR